MNQDKKQAPASKPDKKNRWRQRLVDTLSVTIFVTIFISIMLLMAYTLQCHDKLCTTEANNLYFITQIICWFDPIFTLYNLFLLLLITMIVPVITLFYVLNMKTRKKQRIKQNIRDAEISDEKVKTCLDKTFRMSHYAGSMTLLSIVILLGGMIILLLKPMPVSEAVQGSGLGVDFRKGANFLMLGSYMHYYIEGNIQQHMRVLSGTLTAFQFGFFGAYVYFITHLVRSYFTLDLSPNIYIACTVRIMMGALLSLVISFGIISVQLTGDASETNTLTGQADSDVLDQAVSVSEQVADITIKSPVDYYYYLPIISFFIGFFPSRGLLMLERSASRLLHLTPLNYNASSLTGLSGMSYQHEIRLNREGLDNIENFVEADIFSLSIHTGFSYRQLYDWQSQAKLATCLGNDYARFKQATSIDSVEKLLTSADWFKSDSNDGALVSVIDEALYQKTKIVLNNMQQAKQAKNDLKKINPA